MRKLIAISLIGIYCFNLFGYIVLFHFLEQSAYTQTIGNIDNATYKCSDLVEVKVAYPLPYSVDWKDYERIDGKISINGVQYNYVKKKLCNDTLYMLCIPNEEKMKLTSAEHNYSSLVNDAANNCSNKKSNSSSTFFQKIFSAAFNQIHTLHDLTAVCKSLAQQHCIVEMSVHNCFIPILHQPPQATA